MHKFDVVVIGAGAAGLFCAGQAGQQGLKVLLVDHSDKVAEKIRISGGGRCNFTNRDATPAQFLSENPHFCRSALSRYTPQDFIALLQRHSIAFHEKHKGQLFCDRSAEDIINMLLAECDAGQVTRWQSCSIKSVLYADQTGTSSYQIESEPRPDRSAAGGDCHRRPVDPENRRDRFRLPHRQAVRPAPGRATRRAGAADL